MAYSLDEQPANVLRVSCAAPLDRDDNRAETTFQNGYDLGAAKRRQLHALVGPKRLAVLSIKDVELVVTNQESLGIELTCNLNWQLCVWCRYE